jgi:hypothetical protein
MLTAGLAPPPTFATCPKVTEMPLQKFITTFFAGEVA